MKIILSSTLLVAASARKLQEFTAIAGFSPLTDVRDQVRAMKQALSVFTL